MAKIDYTGIMKATRDTIANDANVRALRTTVEIARAVLTMNATPHVNIFEGRRVNATQVISAGKRHRYTLHWQVVVSAFSAAGFEDAMSQRDELLGYVELALMSNRSLGGILTHQQLQLAGGELRSNPGDNRFWSQGAIDLTADVDATL